MQNVIALTGPKGSGKDTVADIISRQYTHRWYTVDRIAFADPIKKMVQHIFGLNVHSNDQYDLFKRTNLTYTLPGHMPSSVEGRRVVREIGMLMRDYDTNQFTKYVEEFVASGVSSDNRIVVVTDLRFSNEYESLKGMGAKIVKIKRPGCLYDGHITEQEFADSGVDYVINNDGSFVSLQNQVIDMVDQFIEEWK